MSSSVRQTTLKTINEINEIAQSIPWNNPSVYSQFLAQTYFYVRNATRVLAKAAYRCTHEEEDLHKNLIRSINEEKNHEIMATNDLAEIGYSIHDFKELPTTSAYYQTLLAMIDYDGPYALLGYFVALEGVGAIGADHVLNEALETYGKKATQFLRVHIRVDEHHFHNGLNFIETLPLEKQNIVEKYVKISGKLYINMLNEVLAISEAQTPARAA